MTALLVNLILDSNSLANWLATAAFTLIGSRIFLIKLYMQMRGDIAQTVKQSCMIVNMFHLWGEFAVFLLAYTWFNHDFNEIYRERVFSNRDLIKEIGIASLYVISVLVINANVLRQSLYSFTNQFITSSVIGMVGLIMV